MPGAGPTPPDPLHRLFPQLGAAPLRKLATEFHRRVSESEVLMPLYPEDDLAGAETRLADFLIFRCGGPPDYLQRRGHPALRRRHAPFPITPAVRDEWMLRMEAALAAAELPEDARALLREFLSDAATFLINQPASRR